jgi:uncharacterized protein DUF4153
MSDAPVPPPMIAPGPVPSVPPGWMLGPGGWVRVGGVPGQPMVPLPPMPQRLVRVSVFDRHWPGPGRTAGAPRIAISLIVVAAVVGAVGLVLDRPGLGWLLTACALAGLAVATGLTRTGPARGPDAVANESDVDAHTGPAGSPDAVADESDVDVDQAADSTANQPPAATTPPGVVKSPIGISFAKLGERVFWGVCALALASVGTFRAAGWLFFWCVVFAAVWSPVLAIFRAPAWIIRGVKSPRPHEGPRIVVATAVSVLLLIVFGGLFAGADAEFRHVLGSILPPLRASDIVQAIFCFVVVGAVACGVAFLAGARPKFDEMEPIAPRRVRRAEWVLPLTVLNVLFAVFVFIQLTVLFGGDRSLANASRAYMRGYAHNGFWQLLVVSLLTLTVLLVTSRIAPRETPTDRTLLRVLLGGLSAFSIVIVLAALKRVSDYEHTYGYTRLRVVVAGVELWFGLLFVLILLAGITLRASWLPRVLAASLVLSLLAGAIANPDRYVAQQNVNRYLSTGKLSISYMRQLSADAVPAIDQLPPDLRACALRTVAGDLSARGDDWRTWNFARVDARNELRGYVHPAKGVCHNVIG